MRRPGRPLASLPPGERRQLRQVPGILSLEYMAGGMSKTVLGFFSTQSNAEPTRACSFGLLRLSDVPVLGHAPLAASLDFRGNLALGKHGVEGLQFVAEAPSTASRVRESANPSGGQQFVDVVHLVRGAALDFLAMHRKVVLRLGVLPEAHHLPQDVDMNPAMVSESPCACCSGNSRAVSPRRRTRLCRLRFP